MDVDEKTHKKVVWEQRRNRELPSKKNTTEKVSKLRGAREGEKSWSFKKEMG